MKLTKSKLKQIIKEELKTLNEYEIDKYNVGDFVEVTISDNGYDRDIEKLTSVNDFEPTLPNNMSAKFVAQIVKIAEQEAPGAYTGWYDDRRSTSPRSQHWKTRPSE